MFFELILCGTLGHPTLGDYFLSHVRKVFNYNLFRYFLRLSFSSSETTIIWMVVCLMLSLRSLRLLLYFFFIVFSLFCSTAEIPTILFSRSLIYSASVIFLLIPSCGIFISVIVLFICVCSLVLLDLYSTFLVSSWSTPLFFFWHVRSSLPSLIWILFHIDCLSPLHLVIHVDIYIAFFGNIFLCCLILPNLLCLWFPSGGS